MNDEWFGPARKLNSEINSKTDYGETSEEKTKPGMLKNNLLIRNPRIAFGSGPVRDRKKFAGSIRSKI